MGEKSQKEVKKKELKKDVKEKEKAAEKTKEKAKDTKVEKPKAKEKEPKDSKEKAKGAEKASEKKSEKKSEAKKKEEKKEKPKAKEPESIEEDDTRKKQTGVVEEKKPKGKGACAVEASDEENGGEATKTSRKLGQADRSRSRDKGGKEKEKAKEKEKSKEKPEKPPKKPSSSSQESSGFVERRAKRRAEAGLKAASGFSLAPVPSGTSFGPAPNPVAALPDVTSELLRVRQAVEAATGKPAEPRMRLDQREEEQETKLKMAEELREGLLDPSNQKQLLSRTSLISASLAQDGQVVLRAPSKQSLKDAMSVLARVAHHCQWGCNTTKVGLLLREKPEKPVHTVVVRLAATSSRMRTQEGKVNQNKEKLRVGTDASQCQIVLEPIAGLSRKHVTITFEHDKGGCYVQDMSTNGTRLNGKRLPRPPYKHPMDARVRIFHGDELVLAITPEGEELGFVVNLFELSG